jgi:hypothetical protein
MIKKIILFLLLPAVSACGFWVDPLIVPPSAWLNTPAEKLIDSFGPPESDTALENGYRRYTWLRRKVQTPLGTTYLGAGRTVRRHPDVVTSKPVRVEAITDPQGLVKDFQVNESR